MYTLWIIASFLLGYIYIGYPIILFITARIFPKSHRVNEKSEPSITLIISAYNEENIIEKKLENALQMDYARDKLTILVVSDASTDKTDQLVEAFKTQGVILLRMPERKGKTAGLNKALESVSSELVCFSDANALYQPDALRKMVRHFTDETIGFVVGQAIYRAPNPKSAGLSEIAYWDLELRIKKWESAFSSVVGADGAIYTIRKKLWDPLQETDINDFVNPLQIIDKGYRGVFDPEAVCFENPADDFEKEFNRKVRIANRSLNGLLRVPGVLKGPGRGRFSWQVVSHKLLRWFSPYVLLFHFLTTVSLIFYWSGGILPELTLNLYGTGAILALWGYRKNINGRSCSKCFYLPYYFYLLNLAGAKGVWLRIRGEVISTWETVRTGTSLGLQEGSSLPILLWTVILSTLLNWTVKL